VTAVECSERRKTNQALLCWELLKNYRNRLPYFLQLYSALDAVSWKVASLGWDSIPMDYANIATPQKQSVIFLLSVPSIIHNK